MIADCGLRIAEFVVQCAWCRKVETISDFGLRIADWVAASPVPGVKVSHGICPECFAVKLSEIQQQEAA